MRATARVAHRGLVARRRTRGCLSASSAVLIGLATVVTACGSAGTDSAARSASPESSSASVPAPPGDLYTPPDPLTSAPPGTLIWAEEVDGIELRPPATVWRILYHSRSRDDLDIAVSGFAVVPTAPNLVGDRPVYAWAHGTVGLGDQCAPSHEVRDNLPPYGGRQVERGAVLVATDYEGLGTPGVPTSTVAHAEAHAVLDSVRAVAALPGVGALGAVVVAGHSQGGRAALVAAEIAPAYAPDVDLVGAVALAPGVELPALVDHLAASPRTGAAIIGAIGLRAGYPDVDLATVFTRSTIGDVGRIERECVDVTIARYASLPTGDVISHVPSTAPGLHALLEENSPGTVAPPVPIFLGHGTDDREVPVDLSEQLQAKYCALGVAVTRRTYGGRGHAEAVDAAAEDAMAFITERFDRRTATGEC